MRHKLHDILIVLLVLLPYFKMEASEATADSVYQRLSRFVQNIATFNRILPQEKVYLHFDNTAYYIGETIWFKAYVVRADTHRQTDLSGILHVQLITREGTVIDSRKLKIVQRLFRPEGAVCLGLLRSACIHAVHAQFRQYPVGL